VHWPRPGRAGARSRKRSLPLDWQRLLLLGPRGADSGPYTRVTATPLTSEPPILAFLWVAGHPQHPTLRTHSRCRSQAQCCALRRRQHLRPGLQRGAQFTSAGAAAPRVDVSGGTTVGVQRARAYGRADPHPKLLRDRAHDPRLRGSSRVSIRLDRTSSTIDSEQTRGRPNEHCRRCVRTAVRPGRAHARCRGAVASAK
jgi:hypothetical protein